MAEQEGRKTTRIKKYRRPLNINIGMVIFAVIFIYVCICIRMYFKDNHIRPYEVREGSLAANHMYTGIVLRDEIPVAANAAGYVNYYAREGERVAVGNLVYTVDETGRLVDYLSSAQIGDNALKDSDLYQMKSDIVNFVHGFSPRNFGSVYDFKYSVKGTVIKLTNTTLLDSIASVNRDELGGMVNMAYAAKPGIVMYWMDGYEELTADMVTKAVFKSDEYEKKQFLSNDLVSVGDTVYKVCSNENWSIVIPLEDEKRAIELEQEGYVKVRFMKNQDESWAAVEIIRKSEKEIYAKLSFTNSMVTFTNDRFLDVELLLHDETGLKIPNTSIVEREFFLIPERYVTRSGDTDSYGVLREAVLENGTRTTEYVEVSIYSLVDGEYYVDAGVLHSGDHLMMTDSVDTYTVSKRATLIGVFNMNKGYADFRQIEILYQNDEYAIVKSNTEYGLNVYDLIVQDASSIRADQFIYK